MYEMWKYQESEDQNRENQSALPAVRSAAKCAYGALDVLDFVSRLKQVNWRDHVQWCARDMCLSYIHD